VLPLLSPFVVKIARDLYFSAASAFTLYDKSYLNTYNRNFLLPLLSLFVVEDTLRLIFCMFLWIQCSLFKIIKTDVESLCFLSTDSFVFQKILFSVFPFFSIFVAADTWWHIFSVFILYLTFLLENSPNLMTCFLCIQCFWFQTLLITYSLLSFTFNAWSWKYHEICTSIFVLFNFPHFSF
jgi:hypothetical protein